jgi:hypothetical protein
MALRVWDPGRAKLYELVHEISQTLSLIVEWGSSIAASEMTNQGHPVTVHEAVIHRTIREFERGKLSLAKGIRPLDGGDPGVLSRAFDDNISALHEELSTQGESVGCDSRLRRQSGAFGNVRSGCRRLVGERRTGVWADRLRT